MACDRNIKVDKEVVEALQKIAKGFERPNAILRRLLGLKPKIYKTGRPPRQQQK